MADGLGEFELEFEGEGEFEFENEAEAFGWGDVKNWAGNQWSALNTPGSWQRKALINADKAILTGGGAALGASLGAEPGAVIGGALGAGAASLLPDKEFESEFEFEGEGEGEFEFEGEGEFESFVNPVNRIYPDAMMEHMGLAAMESESEFEAAEHFLPLIPLAASKLLPIAGKALPRVAAKVLPRIVHAVNHATPRLTRSVSHLTRTLHRDPRTRPLVRAIPSVARRAVHTIARHAAAGRPVSPKHAVRILARENHRVLHNPKILRGVLRHSNKMDGVSHRLTGLPAHPAHLHRHLHPHRHLAALQAHHQGHPTFGRGLPTSGITAPGVIVRPRHAHLLPYLAGQGRASSVCPTCGRPAGRSACCCCS